MIELFKSKRASSILGLSFDGNKLEAVVVRRNNGSLQIQQTVSAPLALSPLSGDPQLVGREIRNHLNQAGIRERRCAVCLPLNWVLTVQTKLPDLPEEDVASFLEIEAERGFPSGHEQLYIANLRARATGGGQYAILMGIPRNHLATLERALKAAQLKPLSFSLGVTALAAARDAQTRALTLSMGSHGIDLQVSAGGGILALRLLDGGAEGEGAQRTMDADLVARQIRITLGQVPVEFVGDGGAARIFARNEIAPQFLSDLARRIEAMGLRVETARQATDAQFTESPPAALAMSPALALASNYLRAGPGAPEFLPPKVSAWQQMMTSGKLSSRKLAWAGGAAGGLAACVILAFLIQQWQISRLESHWKSIEPKVTRLQLEQDRIREFRPWYDSSFRALRIMKAVTEAFPEDGNVTAKSLEIRDLLTVTCSGIARDNQSYLALLDKLGASDNITELKTEMVRGQSPVQFTLNFQWLEGGKGNGN